VSLRHIVTEKEEIGCPPGKSAPIFSIRPDLPEAETIKTTMRAEANFSWHIKLIWPVQSLRQKFSAFPKSDSLLS